MLNTGSCASATGTGKVAFGLEREYEERGDTECSILLGGENFLIRLLGDILQCFPLINKYKW